MLQLMFLCGVGLTIGPSATLKFFMRRKNLKVGSRAHATPWPVLFHWHLGASMFMRGCSVGAGDGVLHERGGPRGLGVGCGGDAGGDVRLLAAVRRLCAHRALLPEEGASVWPPAGPPHIQTGEDLPGSTVALRTCRLCPVVCSPGTSAQRRVACRCSTSLHRRRHYPFELVSAVQRPSVVLFAGSGSAAVRVRTSNGLTGTRMDSKVSDMRICRLHAALPKLHKQSHGCTMLHAMESDGLQLCNVPSGWWNKT